MAQETFTEAQKQQIKERDGYKCAVCGNAPANGVEIFVRPVLEGAAILENGQVLCAEHKDSGAGLYKDVFLDLRNKAKEAGDKKLENFAASILQTYEKHGVDKP